MKWEYKTIRLNCKGVFNPTFDEIQLDGMMNDLGSQGWELAAAFDTTNANGATQVVVAILKRQRQ